MKIEEWKSQLKRGILEYCILLLIDEKPYYGYDIISEISKYEIISAKESTVYPLLRRLEKEAILKSEWKNSQEGLPPRKYYELTEEGRGILKKMSKEWGVLVSVIKGLDKERE